MEIFSGSPSFPAFNCVRISYTRAPTNLRRGNDELYDPHRRASKRNNLAHDLIRIAHLSPPFIRNAANQIPYPTGNGASLERP